MQQALMKHNAGISQKSELKKKRGRYGFEEHLRFRRLHEKM
jgi:hypothetical protein